MHEYAFDVKLAAVVRVKARSQQAALSLLRRKLDCETPPEAEAAGVRITEISIDDEAGPHCFEIDGEDTDTD